MPYITLRQRLAVTKDLANLLTAIDNVCAAESCEPDGILNYVFTTMLLSTVAERDEARYIEYERAIGILECAKLELYRKAVAPYEDKKAAENGEVYP